MEYSTVESAGYRLKESTTRFIEKKLKRKVNEEKSAVDRPRRRKFLGVSFTFHKDPKIRIAKESIEAAKQGIREITSRSKPISIGERIRRLNEFFVGWCNYFSLADTPSPFKDLDGWIRRRLRMCLCKQWKKPITKRKRLLALEVINEKALRGVGG